MAYCEVNLNVADCEAPPVLEGGGPVRTKCFACGRAACKKCSRRIKYLSFGHRRVCNDCIEDWGL